jgi:hypothetical protein
MVQNFLRRARECQGTVFFYYLCARGEMLPMLLRGAFPGVAASDWAFPYRLRGNAAQFFAGLPGSASRPLHLDHCAVGNVAHFFLALPDGV